MFASAGMILQQTLPNDHLGDLHHRLDDIWHLYAAGLKHSLKQFAFNVTM